MDQHAKKPDGVVQMSNNVHTLNFGLRQDEFDDMLSQLIDGNEQLFEHIFLSHFEDCRKYIATKYTMEYEVSYDITMDTMLEFRLKLIQGKITYGNLRFLFTRMASNNFVKQLNHDQKMKGMLLSEEIEESYHEERFDQLSVAWHKLDVSERDLLAQYYYEEKPLKEIAESINVSDAALRKKKQRAMDSLRNVFFKNFNH